MSRPRTAAFAYLRTSSATNVGPDKDSDCRQREAIAAFGQHAGYRIVEEFYDAAVSGADPIDQRPGFSSLLQRVADNGVRTVLVEDAGRFARTLMTQEAGIATLAGLGVRVITCRGDDLTDSDDEMRVAMRQIVGAMMQLEKTRLVKRLAGARQRKRAEQGWCEAGLPFVQRYGEAIALAKKLSRKNPKTGQRRSLRQLSAILADHGHFTTARYRGNTQPRPFSLPTIKAMLTTKL